MSTQMLGHPRLEHQLSRYEDVFKHYDFDYDSSQPRYELHSFLDRQNRATERNESNQKTITAKSVTQKTKLKGKSSSTRSSKAKKADRKANRKDKVIKIPVPDVAKSRKTTYTNKQQPKQSTKSVGNSNVTPSAPLSSLNALSLSTIKRTPQLPNFEPKTKQATPPPQPNFPPAVPQSISNPIEHSALPFSPTKDPPPPGKSVSFAQAAAGDGTFEWDIEEISRFTREISKRSTTNDSKPPVRPTRILMKCMKNEDDDLNRYISSRFNCLDGFEDYINSLKRQHGIIRHASVDPPIFEPNISIMGPSIKKNTAVVDREDAAAIKRVASLEPRKKYALVHEEKGIFIIGGYHLYVDIPAQKEPETDYLIKFNGDLVKISPITPGRVHFGIFTDGMAIYIAGGQTLNNTLLDDIQRLNMQTLKWEHVATLLNPIAACGMTIDSQRIFLVGGYDIVLNHTILLTDYSIYNLSTQQFEKSTDLPSPRCRSLVFATSQAIFCVSGLMESRDENGNKKLTICTDILKWSSDVSKWVKVSQTPELSKHHALSYDDPYLEITKRFVNENDESVETHAEAHYHFPTNTWASGKAPVATASLAPPKKTPPTKVPKTPAPLQKTATSVPPKATAKNKPNSKSKAKKSGKEKKSKSKKRA